MSKRLRQDAVWVEMPAKRGSGSKYAWLVDATTEKCLRRLPLVGVTRYRGLRITTNYVSRKAGPFYAMWGNRT